MSREGTTNRGNQAEVILSAAIIAKFIDRPAKDNKTPWVVTDREIKDVMSKMVKNAKLIPGTGKNVDKIVGSVKLSRKDIELSKKRNKSIKNYREIATIVDKIDFHASIPKPDFQYLQKKTNWPTVQDLFASSLLYVNNHTQLNAQAKRMAVNARVDNFVVAAAGTEDQTGTKIDIKMTLNGKLTRTQISLKVKGGDQFAQVGGVGFEKQAILWKDKLGLDVRPLEVKYDRMMKKFDYGASYDSNVDKRIEKQKDIVKRATDVVFDEAAKLMNRKLKNKTYIKKIIKFIKEGVAGNEADIIELVKLEGSKYKRIKFDEKFDEAMESLDLVAKTRPTGDPLLYIDDANTDSPLIQIRMKVARESSVVKGKKIYRVYPRTIIEAPSKSIMYTLIE